MSEALIWMQVMIKVFYKGAKCLLLESHHAVFIPTHLSTSDSFPKLTMFHGMTLQFNVVTL
jgi:hypothetical protein